MKISLSNNLPSTAEVVETLKSKFSNSYSFKFSGIGRNKSIIARKSMFVGVQITRSNNELNVEGIFPSMPFLIIRSLLLFGAGDLGVIRKIFPSKWLMVEKELGCYLNHQYS